MMQINELSYNTVLNNPSFQSALKRYTIKIVAPASGTAFEKIRALEKIPGLKLDFSTLLQNQDIPFHAANDEQRFFHLQNALYSSDENSLIWTLRGGYGSARLIEKLKRLPPPPQEKIFIGFSDNTALHLFLTQHWNWKTIHGSGFSQLLDPQQDPLNFLKLIPILENQTQLQSLTDLKPLNQHAIQATCLRGKLTGGNLTLLQCSIGTQWQMNAQEKIVLIEEVNEQGYRIDRSLLHLHQAGLFNGCEAIVFGQFLCKAQEKEVHIALQRFADNTTIPVYQSHQFGHGNVNYPLILNAFAEIAPMEEGTFSLDLSQF